MVEEGEFKSACDKLEADYVAEWRDAKTIEAREDYHKLITLMDRLKLELVSVITTGLIEEQKQANGQS